MILFKLGHDLAGRSIFEHPAADANPGGGAGGDHREEKR